MRSFIDGVERKVKRLVGRNQDVVTDASPLADSYVPREEVQEQIAQRLESGDTLFHVAGQPGIGKTFLLDWVEEEFGEAYAVERVRLGSHHSIQTLSQKIYRTILDDIPESVKEGDRELTGASGSVAGVGGGASWAREPPDWAESPFKYIEALEQMIDHVPDGYKRLICLDDIHKIDGDEQKINDALTEIAEALGPEIALLSAGRLQFESQVPVIRLSTFSEAQTVELLANEVPDITAATARKLHNRLGGHPYYLGLLVDIEDPAAAIEVPEEDIHHYIEVEYLDALTGDEERFLQATSPLTELDEHVCSAVLADHDTFDQVGIRRLLRGLNKQVIVQDVGSNPDGTTRYAIHDKFRDFLLQQQSNPDEVHAAAFSFYTNQLRSQMASDGTDFEQETHATTMCTHHLSALLKSHDQADEIADFLDTTLDEEGLPFYTTTILLDELKEWQTEDVLDTVVATVLSKLQEREPLARYFFDEAADLSWGEELYHRGVFNDPSGPELQYLDSIVDQHPDFVVKIITNVDSEDANKRQALISIAGELPADAAAQTADIIESWARESPSFQRLDFYAAQLVEHLIEHGEPEAALTVLQGVLQPPERDPDFDWQQDRQFEQYEFHELFQATIETFVEECGRDFIDVLDEALRQTLASETDEEGELVHESVASRTPIPDLAYHEDNTGERKHILFTYLSQAAEQWVAADPTAADREAFITTYLDVDIPSFRRIGLFLLARHADIYRNLVAEELSEEANYDDDSIQYDFYRLVETAFSSLDAGQQDHVYSILRHGPEDKQWIKDRAAHLATDRPESQEEIEQEIVERWRLKRLYPLDGDVPDDKQDYIDELLKKYGTPERTASQPYTPSVRGGFVGEKGPEDLDTLRDQTAETVLQTCVEWEPPDDQSWFLDDDDERVEASHWGFAKQLRQLVQEQPAVYAKAIHILEDAKPQYADVVLDAFVDTLQEGGRFPWPPVLAFCEKVVDEPSRWSSRCRVSIAQVVGQGIQSDHIDFPDEYIDRVEELLITLLTDPELDPNQEQPQSWIGGVGTTEEEVRQYALRVISSYIVWQDQHDRLDTDRLDDPLRQVLKERITDDAAGPVRNELGRHFRTFWVVDEDLIRAHLDDLFPRGDGLETKQLFAAAWNGYTRSNPLLTPAFPRLRPYYLHALDLLAEDESEGLIDAETTAYHIGLTYVFEDESLDDEASLIAQFYQMMQPETAAKLAQGLSKGFENEDSKLHQHWEAMRDLWQWRLDKLKDEITEFEEAAEYHREFRYFLQSLQHTDASGIVEEQDLVERTAPFLVQQPHSIRRLEDWLAEQSASHPTEAMSIYHAVVETIPEDVWHSVARSSKEELRETLYTNAMQASDEAGSLAFKVANRFAAAGYDRDKEFLDRYLGENGS